MAKKIVKKLSTEYLIYRSDSEPTIFTIGKNPPNNAEVTINGNLVVASNLTVQGSVTSITTTNTEITDRVVTLNAGETGAGVSGGVSGFEVDRGTLQSASILWSEPDQKWQLVVDGVAKNIATAGTGGQYITDVVEDLTPQLGGDLDINGFKIVSINNNLVLAPADKVQIDSAIQLKEISNPPVTGLLGFNLVYAAPTTGGGTGLYVAHDVTVDQEVNQELISKRKAILYSLLF